jgi:long-chain acyl-CoA synthetase
MTVMPSAKPWLANYDPGVPKTVDILNIPLFKLLEEAAQKFTNNTAMVFRGKKITFRELNELADAIAAGLAAHGFKKGDRAVIYMPNSPQFVMTYYGILKAGGIVIGYQSPLHRTGTGTPIGGLWRGNRLCDEPLL